MPRSFALVFTFELGVANAAFAAEPEPVTLWYAQPACAQKIKAAVRTLRAEGAKRGLNGKITPVGFSRGSGMALMLVTTERMKEFENHGENPGVSSDVQGADGLPS